MEIEIRPGKHPTEWKLKAVTRGWSPQARDVYRGLDADAIYSDLCAWFCKGPLTERTILDAVNGAISATQNWIDSGFEGRFFSVPEGGEATYSDIKDALGQYLQASTWWLAVALESLDSNDPAHATRAIGHAKHLHGIWEAQFECIKAELDCAHDTEGVTVGRQQAARMFASMGGKARARIKDEAKNRIKDYLATQISDSEKSPAAARKIEAALPNLGMSHEAILTVVRQARRDAKT